MTDPRSEHVRVEYGVRYGDGVIDDVHDTEAEALGFIESIRRNYGTPVVRNAAHLANYAPEDYEPMTVVTRTVRTTIEDSGWSPVRDDDSQAEEPYDDTIQFGRRGGSLADLRSGS